MYSYDWLENLVGLGIHTTDESRDEWQHLAAGDCVVVVPKGWGLMSDGYSFPVAGGEPGRAIVLRQAPPEHPCNAVWTFVVEPGLAPPRARRAGERHRYRGDGPDNVDDDPQDAGPKVVCRFVDAGGAIGALGEAEPGRSLAARAGRVPTRPAWAPALITSPTRFVGRQGRTSRSVNRPPWPEAASIEENRVGPG